MSAITLLLKAFLAMSLLGLIAHLLTEQGSTPSKRRRR